jgi:alpha-tubulin suppressor-like RCC1 family protein
MPNLILKTGTTAISGAVVKGSFSYFSASTRDLGPTSVTGLYNGFNPPNGGFTVYYTGANTPAGWTCRIASNTSALNTLLISLGGTGSTVAQNVTWANNTNSILLDSGGTVSTILVSAAVSATVGSLAIKNGVAYGWGQNTAGAIGNNTTTSATTPTLVCGGLTFTSISAGALGFAFSLGITNTGVAYAWGYNISGQLGDNSTTTRLTPVLVCGGFTFSSISAGGGGAGGFGLGVTSGGRGRAWGANSNGQLGDNSTTQRNTPVLVCGGLTFTSISAGGAAAFAFSLGLTNTGTAYGWGGNVFGQVGDNSTTQRNTPVLVCGGLTFTSISAGGTHSLGITNTGAAYGWGWNNNGQLGDNSTTTRLTPVLVCGGLTFTSISAGASHSLGITNTGVAYAWGSNSSGGLGDNSTTSRLTPVLVCGGFTFTSISAGNAYSLGVTNTGVVYGWGSNGSGVLGDNSLTSRLTPVQVCVL